MIVAGGIDLGGTKIEASIFDAHWQPVNTRRIATPQHDYQAMIDALVDQITWLEAQSAGSDHSDHSDHSDRVGALPIGVGTPGIINSTTGLATTANLPSNGKSLFRDVTDAAGRPLVFANDCDMLTLSEAVLGAGRDFQSVFGLILGTGTGGGFARDGHLTSTLNGASGEIGHMSVPFDLAMEFDLPLLACGCGRRGCYETLVSGVGLQRIHALLGGRAEMSPPEIAAAAQTNGRAIGDGYAQQSLSIWYSLLADLIHGLQVTFDMDCVVLGGGLSNMNGLIDGICAALPRRLMTGAQAPVLRLAEYGDSSGTRGAALAALDGVNAQARLETIANKETQ
jgi:N-acetylglucosamine kinase